jgi:hypothetical protein
MYTSICLERLRKTTKSSDRMAGLRTENRAQGFPTKRQKCEPPHHSILWNALLLWNHRIYQRHHKSPSRNPTPVHPIIPVHMPITYAITYSICYFPWCSVLQTTLLRWPTYWLLSNPKVYLCRQKTPSLKPILSLSSLFHVFTPCLLSQVDQLEKWSLMIPIAIHVMILMRYTGS